MRSIKIVRDIYIGKNTLEITKDISENFKKPAIVSDKNTLNIAGNRVADLISGNTIITEGINTKENVEKIKSESNGYDILFAVGGGTVIDLAKVISKDYNIPFVSIPTTLSNDGIASPNASLRSDKGAISYVAHPPISIIIDTDIIANAPDRFIKSGIGDSIAKYSAVRDWQLGHIKKREKYGHYASSLSTMTAKQVMNRSIEIIKGTEKGLALLGEALISAGVAMGIAGSSRPASGSEHKISHALDIIAKFPHMHGSQCGVTTLITTYMQGGDWRRIKNSLEAAKCPTSAKDLNVDEDIMMEAVLKAREIHPERYTILEDMDLDREQIRKVLEETEVI